MRAGTISAFLLLLLKTAFCQPAGEDSVSTIFWEIRNERSIVWDVEKEIRLPHEDNIELSGKRVSVIVKYSVDKNKNLSISRHIIYPQLRVHTNSGDSPWAKYRAYLKSDYGDEYLPSIITGNSTYLPGPVDSIVIEGVIRFFHKPVNGIGLNRVIMPSMSQRLVVENWELTNLTDSILIITSGEIGFSKEIAGVYGLFRREVTTDIQKKVVLQPGMNYNFSIYFAAYLDDEPAINSGFPQVLSERTAFLDTISKNLVLRTPDPVFNTLFHFSKIRASESIFETPMGLVHSPGGGRYYAGVWANDQAEYSGPFFTYLGYKTGNMAALNAYKVFLNHIPEGDGHFWSSFEMNGDLTCCGSDRGDAAMIAFGASHYALASGRREVGEELWPLIKWSLGYCQRKKNQDGVVTSDSDEMEGRISTGDANLATSSLYYGALLLSADLAESLGETKASISYASEARQLKSDIHEYFGATIEGLETYRYYKGHEHLRHWICLPLVMGINDRKEGTLEALFSKLWTDNGVRVEFNPELEEPDLFWDRGTLYAFRGAFKAGATDRACEKLKAFSTTRLLGNHVPYVVEAWPEGNMAHLSAESALYCRIFTEGLLGINPTGFNSFECSPRLPAGWDHYSLNDIYAFNRKFSLAVKREATGIRLNVSERGQVISDQIFQPGQTIGILFH